MARFLRFEGFPHCQVYQSDEQTAWSAGEVRQVSDGQAAYLIGTFGPAFTVDFRADPRQTNPGLTASPMTAALAAPPVARADHPPAGASPKPGAAPAPPPKGPPRRR